MLRLAPCIGSAGLIGAMLIGPLVSHPEYSSLSHTISQLAGQNMPNAWIMRTGFILYGLGALLGALAHLRQTPLFSFPVLVFGAGLIGVGLWSAAPIDAALGVDPREDAVHSFLASLIGAAFALSCAARLFLPGGARTDWLSWAGLLASVLLPLGMLALPPVAGGLQRLMFGISILWLCRTLGASHVQIRTN